MKTIVHISEVNICLNSGMGRVEYYWKLAFEKSGYKFIHIGPNEVGKLRFKSFFGFYAYVFYKKMNVKATAFIVHEPLSGYFVNKGIPCFLESHGIEIRARQVFKKYKLNADNKNNIRNYLFNIYRNFYSIKGIKNVDKLLLLNTEDKEFLLNKFKRKESDIFIYKNGIHQLNLVNKTLNYHFTILFNGSYIKRKGIDILIDAAKIISDRIDNLKFLLIGTGYTKEDIIEKWPNEIRDKVTIIPKFNSEDEASYLSQTDLFVLPSFYEGQPLSLLQAMSAGICCITTNTCGQKDIIEHYKNGLLFDPGNSLQLANLIIEMKNNVQKRTDIGINAKLSIQDRSWTKCSNELVNYITKQI